MSSSYYQDLLNNTADDEQAATVPDLSMDPAAGHAYDTLPALDLDAIPGLDLDALDWPDDSQLFTGPPTSQRKRRLPDDQEMRDDNEQSALTDAAIPATPSYPDFLSSYPLPPPPRTILSHVAGPSSPLTSHSLLSFSPMVPTQPTITSSADNASFFTSTDSTGASGATGTSSRAHTEDQGPQQSEAPPREEIMAAIENEVLIVLQSLTHLAPVQLTIRTRQNPSRTSTAAAVNTSTATDNAGMTLESVESERPSDPTGEPSYAIGEPSYSIDPSMGFDNSHQMPSMDFDDASMFIASSATTDILSLPLEIQGSTQHVHETQEPMQPQPHQAAATRTRTLTLSNMANSTALTRYVRVLEIIYEALATNVVITKRDIYYRDVALFRSQRVVDRLVDDIAFHYNVPRASLNVCASGKGRMFGPATIILKSRRVLDCLSRGNQGNPGDAGDDLGGDLDPSDLGISTEQPQDELGTLIPPINQVLDVDTRARCIIVIEKEASFRHLVSAGFVQSMPQPCVLITGCGYPDLATRHMVKHLANRYQDVPIVSLMDNDPYGLDIYFVYKWGSAAQAHDSVNLTIPTMRFMGLCCQDRVEHCISPDGYVPLTIKDREKANRLLKAAQRLPPQSPAIQEDLKQLMRELCRMLYTNHKCEMQALCQGGTHEFVAYLRQKIEPHLSRSN
ncbi:Spo11/DNA topoisomerase VI subunit A [Gongronella butleri]|nr:Spo11/DNA topoisomerase VI subunit A [Gongronella butleri]